MFDAIENLKAAVKQVEVSRGIFRNEMQEADNVGDNQKANFCEDAADSVDRTIVDLRRRLIICPRLLRCFRVVKVREKVLSQFDWWSNGFVSRQL